MARGHKLDRPEAQNLLADLKRYMRQSMLAHLDNRRQMAIDADYYDSIQLTTEQLAVLEDREQPIQIWNVIKGPINWATGVQEKTRLDELVLPRKHADERDAKTKNKLIKWDHDCNYAEVMQSMAFKSAATVGVGYLDISGRPDPDNPLFYGTVDWRDMWWDNMGKRPNYTDWRYMFMKRWIDLDVAQMLFSDRQKELADAAQDTNSRYPYNPEDAFVFDDATDGVSSDYGMTFGSNIEGFRNRVQIVHMQYRKPAEAKVLKIVGSEYGALNNIIFRPDDELHAHLAKYGYANLETQQRMTMRHALWCNNVFLRDIPSPYNHNTFTWVPIFCYRRDRDGMPYGMVRDLRSPQDDLNARKARAYFLMSSEKIIAEQDVIIGSIMKTRDEYNRPDGVLIVAKGALSSNKIRFENGLSAAQQHMAVGRESESFVHNISGVSMEQQGQSKRDLSGVAIEKLENQGATTNNSLFANYFFGLQLAGEIEVSNIEQFLNSEQEIRITGETQKHNFININSVDEEGNPVNSITRAKSDYKLAKADYRETMRQANMATLGDLITTLIKTGGGKGHDAGIAMLDVYVDLYDGLPGKEELLARIRKITGQEALDEDLTPQEKQQKAIQHQQQAEAAEQAKQIQQRMIGLELDERAAKVEGMKAKALADQAVALAKNIDAFLKSMEAAGTVAVAPGLVAGADQLIEDAMKIAQGQHPMQQTPVQQPQQPAPVQPQPQQQQMMQQQQPQGGVPDVQTQGQY